MLVDLATSAYWRLKCFFLSELFERKSQHTAVQPSAGQLAIAKLLELTGCCDLRIDKTRRAYAVGGEDCGKSYLYRLNVVLSKSLDAAVCLKCGELAAKDDFSWRDLSPEACDELAESIAGSFFGKPSKLSADDLSVKTVFLVPEARSAAELMMKFDMLGDGEISTTYRTLIQKIEG